MKAREICIVNDCSQPVIFGMGLVSSFCEEHYFCGVEGCTRLSSPALANGYCSKRHEIVDEDSTAPALGEE